MSVQPESSDPTPSSSSSTQYSFTPASTFAKMSTKPEPAETEAPKEEEKSQDSVYECNICLDTAREAVVSMCGHLFCWPCIHQWLETRPTLQRCPVCKASISKDKVIPLYGRNSTNQEDPRKKQAPPRPQSQREETEANPGFQGFGFDSGFHLSFGIGAFPFGFFASTFNFTDPRQQPFTAQRNGIANLEDDQFLSKIFLWVAIVFFTWLILA